MYVERHEPSGLQTYCIGLHSTHSSDLVQMVPNKAHGQTAKPPLDVDLLRKTAAHK